MTQEMEKGRSCGGTFVIESLSLFTGPWPEKELFVMARVLGMTGLGLCARQFKEILFNLGATSLISSSGGQIRETGDIPPGEPLSPRAISFSDGGG